LGNILNSPGSIAIKRASVRDPSFMMMQIF